MSSRAVDPSRVRQDGERWRRSGGDGGRGWGRESDSKNQVNSHGWSLLDPFSGGQHAPQRRKEGREWFCV